MAQVAGHAKANANKDIKLVQHLTQSPHPKTYFMKFELTRIIAELVFESITSLQNWKTIFSFIFIFIKKFPWCRKVVRLDFIVKILFSANLGFFSNLFFTLKHLSICCIKSIVVSKVLLYLKYCCIQSIVQISCSASLYLVPDPVFNPEAFLEQQLKQNSVAKWLVMVRTSL